MIDAREANRHVVRSLYEDCINTGALDRLSGLVAPDYVGPRGERGAEGFAQTIRSLRAAFPDIRFTLEELIADGDRVAVRWIWRGTHSGTFREFAASGKPVTNEGIAIYQLQDGKVRRAWLQNDRLSVLQQIGVLSPELGSPQSPRPAIEPANPSGG